MKISLKSLFVTGAIGTIVIALMGLLGYVPGLGFLGAAREGYIPMAPSTAISFIVMGITLLILVNPLSRAKIIISLFAVFAVALFGILEVAGHFSGMDLNLEDMLVPFAGELDGVPIARMSPATGATFFFAGIAVLLLVALRQLKHTNTSIKDLAGLLGTLVLIVSFVFCLAYFYGTPLLYGQGSTVPMALTTALGFLFLSVSILACEKEAFPLRLLTNNSTTSYLLRFILPFSVFSVLLVGFTEVFLSPEFAWNPALLLASQTVLVAVISGLVALLLSRHMGSRIDQAEEALRQQFQLNKTITDNAASCLFMMDKQGHTTFMNPAAERVTGYTLDDIRDMPLHDAVHYKYPDGSPYPMSECPIDNAQAELVVMADYEDIFVRKDGSLFPVVCYIAPLEQAGEVVGSVLEFRDVTEQKHAEEEVKKTNSLLSSILESPENIIMFALDTDYNYLSFNQAHVKKMKDVYDADIEIGKYIIDYVSIEEDRIKIKKNYTRALKGEHFIEIQEYGEAEERSWYELIFNPIYDESNIVTGFTAFVTNITRRKKSEEELDQHRHHLEGLVDERTTELVDARQLADAASLAKSDFLANMSHEIRTPMNAITGLTHLMQQADATPEQAERLGKIDAATQYLLSIINNILDISKIEAGKLILEQVDFQLDAVLDDIQTMMKAQVSGKQLSIEVDTDEVPQWLRGDPTRLRQAMLNYVGNAIKFTEQGTIVLRAIKLEENDTGILIRFEVTDNGVGIAPDRLAGLFEAFEQADSSTTRKHGGTGLGLTINRHLARLMGGEVGAESEQGKGSTFWFTSRLARGHGTMPETSATEVERADSGLLPRHHGARILLVEDNAINCEVAVALLSGVGLKVDTAENGQIAVDKVRANDYDLILMDIQMPEVDGLEATRLIRCMEGKRDLPILAMTANVFEEDRNACMEVGMNDFVAKPIEVNAMFKSLAKWLSR